jgi:hypothetical protein
MRQEGHTDGECHLPDAALSADHSDRLHNCMIARLSVHAIEVVTIRGVGGQAVAQPYRIIGKAGRLPDRPLRIDPDDADVCLDWLKRCALAESC